ncbi:MAG TPA: DUF1638 domain-containing protein [Verrucomicrobiae bacterium]|nr:DUF1638 domain-containing protein [Verrucomicrobiae bacterium]
MNRLRLYVISCRVFEREFKALAAGSTTDLQIQFLEMALHERSGCDLRAALQKAIDAVPPNQFDAVALGYGLCNRGLLGLMARNLPVIVPRAHDCISLLLGGSQRYLAEFEQQPNTYFQSSGWIEHLPADKSLRPPANGSSHIFSATAEELIAKYGEENARFLLEEANKFNNHYRRMAFISTPVDGIEARERKASEIAQRRGWQFEKLSGDLAWLCNLVNGDWKENEFLVLKPRERIVARYDGLLMGAESQ